MKNEDRIQVNRCLAHLQANPAENTFKAVKSVAQAFMLGDNFSKNGSTYEPQSKHLGTGVYQLSYKKAGVPQIKL
jgi:hypothetical protein